MPATAWDRHLACAGAKESIFAVGTGMGRRPPGSPSYWALLQAGKGSAVLVRHFATQQLATTIDVNVAYFTTGDTSDLRRLLERVETDHAFYRELNRHVMKLAPMFRPAREKRSWKELLATLFDG